MLVERYTTGKTSLEQGSYHQRHLYYHTVARTYARRTAVIVSVLSMAAAVMSTATKRPQLIVQQKSHPKKQKCAPTADSNSPPAPPS